MTERHSQPLPTSSDFQMVVRIKHVVPTNFNLNEQASAEPGHIRINKTFQWHSRHTFLFTVPLERRFATEFAYMHASIKIR